MPQIRNKVVIDSSPERAAAYGREWAIVAVDVIRATTSAITSVAGGGQCFPVASLEAAWQLAPRLKGPLLAGEVNGEIPPGFEINNSPAELASRNLRGRPVILLSSSGTKLIDRAQSAAAIYLACFRNFRQTARAIANLYSNIAIIGAGTRGEFRIEDQMCCAWIASELIAAGYSPGDERTWTIVEHWEDENPEPIRNGRSAGYLRRTGQLEDLEFVLSHFNDLNSAFRMKGKEVSKVVSVEPPGGRHAMAVRGTLHGASSQ